MLPGEQRVDGALGTGDAEVNSVILSDSQTSEKWEINPLSTAILSTLFIWKIFGGGSEKSKSFSVWQRFIWINFYFEFCLWQENFWIFNFAVV